MIVHIIDPPSPFAPIAELRKFVTELDDLKTAETTEERAFIKSYLDEALKDIEQQERGE